MDIVKGDNGTKLKFTVQDSEGVVDLTWAEVELIIDAGARVVKTATVINAETGECEVVLNAADISKKGFSYLRIKVRFADGKIFNSNIETLNVLGEL